MRHALRYLISGHRLTCGGEHVGRTGQDHRWSVIACGLADGDGRRGSPVLYSVVRKGRQAPGILGSELGFIDLCEVVPATSEPHSPNQVDAAIVLLVP